ncbi:Utp21 specific WD40 associated putative domain-containing protein [Halteromyces radiatus]|uniref:Utp21 specific WD40 associated putative domain-containing protein n=1 Tax=Halteromyces radiatus TaxID=101107 RepID=UPI00221F1014|nr:Utp21 specific WD40 associated putative domain-containing protein [Halteromyces radiatus]KAI8084571.1 Utp21 specific WD40 associated putative domain-containing protein [Halteromyces radiatus]
MVQSIMTIDSKKRRVNKKEKRSNRSKIYQPFRALGYITNDIPFIVESRGQDYFLTTSVGHNFQTYNLAKMNLLFVGPSMDQAITSMAAGGGLTYIACGNTLLSFKRGKELNRIVGDSDYTIFQLIVLGSLVAGLCDDNTLKVWDMTKKELHMEIEFGNDFTVSAMIHPSTYLNKLLIASTQGTMQIWNIRNNKMIYQFQSFGSAISCLVQSPVVDVVAIGLLNGTVLLYNIKVDEKIDAIRQDDRVTAISFRTDEEQMMATANMHGDVSLWDLKQRRLLHIIKGAHDGVVSSLSFLHNQPLLVTGGVDNAVKQWLFEKENAVPRVLKLRSGHYSPPSKIRYYGDDGHYILSTGRDQSLRMFSVYRDSQSFELSQGHLEKKAKAWDVKMQDLKLPLITDFATSIGKAKEWDNILTSHINDTAGRTWSMKRKAIGKHTLIGKSNTAVKVTEITACGNFGLLGSSSGQIDMFNMQSGAHRKTFGGLEGHKKPITGLATDNINRYVISSSVDRTIKIWDFKKATIVHTITLESPIVSIRYLRDNDLLAVVCDDLGIRVIDIETYKVVREFWGHRNRITDLTFTPDGRWLVSSSLDATVRTWDLPTGTLVDIFKVENVVTSLTFSPTGDYLATAHVDNVGIYLWANRTQFTNVSLHSIADDEEVKLLSLPSLATVDSDDEDNEDDESDESDSEAINIKDEFTTQEQLTDKMITLSLEPRSKWQNLLNLETIKQRNKPKEAPKAPEQAPFFLPTVAGAKPTFNLESKDQVTTNEENHDSRRLKFGELVTETDFSKLLRIGHEENKNFTEFVNYTKGLNPSNLDLELRTLTIDSELTCINFVAEAIYFMLETRKNFELAQSWLSVFLAIHGDLIIANPDNPVHGVLQDILQIQQQEFGRLSEKIHYGLCVIDFARKS